MGGGVKQNAFRHGAMGGKLARGEIKYTTNQVMGGSRVATKQRSDGIHGWGSLKIP